MQIQDHSLQKLLVPLDRPIGDSQVDPVESLEIGYLELETDTGITGIGFDQVNYATASTLPSEALHRQFEPVGESLIRASPAALRNQVARDRGGNYGDGPFDRMIDFALWDLAAKYHDLPLYEFMGGDDPRVPAYASGLAFHHPDDVVRDLYDSFADAGFESVKVKVGFENVEKDIERLALIDDAMDGVEKLMIDANEAFSPKEAIRRTRAYQDAGYDVFWFEDPTFREDIEGIQRVIEALPDVHVNTGEYVNLEAKYELLENRAADILNVHGLTSGRRAAVLAAQTGIPLSFGNTPGDVCVHAAASLPEVVFIEHSRIGWDELMETPIAYEDGYAVAPDRPGHGLEFSADALETYAQTS